MQITVEKGDEFEDVCQMALNLSDYVLSVQQHLDFVVHQSTSLKYSSIDVWW